MTDAIDLSKAEWHGTQDISAWPVTTQIASVDVSHRGVVLGPIPDRWPDFIPPGWDGPLQYTLHMGVERLGRWHVAAVHSFWRGRGTKNDDAGGDVFVSDQISKNWLYDMRFGSMRYAQPVPGERVAFFVAAGGQRFDIAPIETVRERSNVVVIAWPTNPRVFAFDAQPQPVPTPQPEPTPDPPQPSPDLSTILASLDTLTRRVEALEATPDPVVIFPDYIGTVSYPIFGSRTVRSKPEGKS